MRAFPILAALAVASGASAATIVERLPPTNNNPGALSSLAGGRLALTPVDLAAGAVVRRVAWIGDALPDAATQRFEVAFQPASLPVTTRLFVQTATPTRVTDRPFEFAPGFPPAVLEQRYDLDLASDVTLVAGTRYLLSIAAVSTPYAWKLFDTSCCAFSVGLATGDIQFLGATLSYALYGDRLAAAPVPEPAGLAVAMAGLAVVARRRRQGPHPSRDRRRA